MKIVSRPDEDEESEVMGSGPHMLRLTDEQLTLITALCAHCRMTKSVYSTAAAEVMTAVEEMHGSGAISDACDLVDLHATIEDDTGVLLSTKSGDFILTLEV